MDLNEWLNRLRGQNPEDAENQKKAAEQFQAGLGRGAPSAPEEPIQELGDESQTEKNDRIVHGVARAELPFTPGAAAADEVAGIAPMSKLGKLAEMPNPEAREGVITYAGKQGQRMKQTEATTGFGQRGNTGYGNIYVNKKMK